MRSFPVLSPRGWSAFGGGLGVLFLGFYALNLMLLVVGTAVTAFALGELFWFAIATGGFGPDLFPSERYRNSAEAHVGGIGSMGVRIDYVGRHPIYAEIFDSHPDSLAMVAGAARLVTWWTPGAERRLVYVFRPLRRGRFLLGPTVIVAHDPFGFAFRVTTLPNPWTVEASLLVPLVPSGPSTFVEDRRLTGPEVVPLRGMGTDFRSLREYQPSDDIRTVAWKKSTRGRLYVREFEQETPQDVLFLLDLGRRMGAGELGRNALDRAVEAAALVARFTLLRGDRTGLLLQADEPILFVPIGRGSDHAAAVRRGLTLAAAEPPRFSAASAFDFLTEKLAAPTHVLMFAAPEGWGPSDAGAYRRLDQAGHRVYLFTPDVAAMYPPDEDPLGQRTYDVVAATERQRLEELLRRLEAVGPPTFVYDRAGPVDILTDLYARVRAWRVAQ